MHHVAQLNHLALKLVAVFFVSVLKLAEMSLKGSDLSLLAEQLIIRGLPVPFELLTQIQQVPLESFLLVHQLHLIPLQIEVPLLLDLDLSFGLLPLSLQLLAPLLQVFYVRPCPP